MSESVIERAGAFVAAWVIEQLRLRGVVRRPYAIINGKVANNVVYHCPEAMK